MKYYKIDVMSKSIRPIIIREQVIKSVREFFTKKEFHEVVIPVFNSSLPLEQNIYSFKTTWVNLKGKKVFYLTTSPEAYLKKMIAKGIGNCFAIGHSFRNMESAGKIHNPEFLMLEWYRQDAAYEYIMREVKELILFCQKVILASESVSASRIRRGSWTSQDDVLLHEWPVISLEYLFKKYARLNLADIIDDKRLTKAAKEKGYKIEDKTWEQIFNQIFLNEIEPHLSPKEPFFLIDYPAKISPLCAKRKDKPYLAQRFELYIAGIEIGNGNTENTDYKSVHKVFKVESEKRKKVGELSPPIDMEFIRALKKMQGKSYAGIGLGVDRLAMMLGGIKNIKQLLG